MPSWRRRRRRQCFHQLSSQASRKRAPPAAEGREPGSAVVVRARRPQGGGWQVNQIASQVAEGGVVLAQLADGEGAGAATRAGMVAGVHCSYAKEASERSVARMERADGGGGRGGGMSAGVQRLPPPVSSPQLAAKSVWSER